MRNCSRFMGCFTVGALALGVSVYAAPRVDGSARGDSKSDASRLVTGEAAHLQSVVDGGVAGGSFFYRIEPVAPLDGSSYPGTVSIAGNTITLAGGPQRIWFDLNMGGWAPNQLQTYQVGILWSEFDGDVGSGDPLLKANDACAVDADCAAAHGPGALCSNPAGSNCTWAWQDGGRANFHGLPIEATAQGAPGATTELIRWGATALGAATFIDDTGGDTYAGSLGLDAQAGSFGTYTINFLQDETTFFTLDDGTAPDLALFTFTPAVVEIPVGKCCILQPAEDCQDAVTEAECDAVGGIFIDDGSTCADGCIECTVDADCNDSDACTNETCVANFCDRSLIFDPALECCNGATGNITSLDDGDGCTDGSCDGSGGCGEIARGGPDSCGDAVFTPSAAGTVCNDGNACTFDDVCDGSNSEADGGCAGTDANTVACATSDDCLLATGSALECQADGFCFCTLSPPLTFDITPGSKADPNCFDDGDKVTATVNVGSSLDVITGGEFLIQYTPGCLNLNKIITEDPFNNVLFVDESVPGEVFVAVGIDLGGTGVGGGNFDILSLSFTKAGGCTGCDLCFGDVNPKHTRLTNDVGQVVTVLPECSKEVRGNGDLTLDTPDGGKFNVACDGATRDVNWDSPSATDTCAVASFSCGGLYENPNTGEVVDVSEIGVSAMSGGTFPVGAATFCCSAANDCGDEQQECWTVTVNDQTSLDVQLQLSPTMTSKPGEGLERCIKFELFSNCTQAPLVFEENVVFGGLFDLVGKVNTTIKIPSAGQFECITARDQLHTLRSCYTFGDADCDADGVLHATFKGDPFFGGNWLVGGNLDGFKKDSATASLDVIDITDFGMFVSQYPDNLGSGDTPCGTEGPNSDINGDGLVDLLDFSFISMNFLEDSKDCCCPGSTSTAGAGRTEVTVRELRANGMGELAVADLNQDGVLNMDDVQLLLQGEVPTTKRPSRNSRTGALR